MSANLLNMNQETNNYTYHFHVRPLINPIHHNRNRKATQNFPVYICLMSEWKKLSSRVVYDNPWIRVDEHQVKNPSGNPGIYGVVHYKNLAIGIIPLDESGNTWLVGQHRYPLNQYSWEIIEGGGSLETDPMESAQRELQEEAGITARKWDPLLEMHLSNSVSDERAIIYLARELEFGKADPDETEDLQLKKIPFTQVVDMVLRGEITDSISVAAVLMLERKMRLRDL
jgi:ADP-ribose pyrophosphatase